MTKLTTNYFDDAGESNDNRTDDVCNVSGNLETVVTVAGALLKAWCDSVNEDYAKNYSMLGWVSKGSGVYERVATVTDESIYSGYVLGHKQTLTLADGEVFVK